MSSGERNLSEGEDYHKGNLSIKDFAVVVVFAALLSIYTAILLALTDFTLAQFLPDYRYSGRYKFGLIIFFVATTIFILFGRWRRWNNWRFFVLGALAVFFPLVFIASTIRLFIGGEGSMIYSYALQYCAATTPVSVCGEAFAASVFTMSLRALPTVITAPALYWYLLFHLPKKKTRQIS